MSRIGTILLAVGLVSGLLAVPLGASAAVAEHNETTATDTIAPGERLAGVVGIQQADVDGDLSDRRYEVRLTNAETAAEKADIVAERRNEIEQRLSDHEAELAELQTAREAGNISEGTYRARVATLAAEKASTERAAGRASETASELPAAVLESRGVSVDELDELRTSANELGGPETADIAREVGGPTAADDRAVDAPGANQAGERPTAGQPEPNRAGNETPADDRPAERGRSTAQTGDNSTGPNRDSSADDQRAGANGATDPGDGDNESLTQDNGTTGSPNQENGTTGSPDQKNETTGSPNQQHTGSGTDAENPPGPNSR